MAFRQRILTVAAVTVAMVGALPARALASSTQESILMDDDHLIYAPPNSVVRTMQTLASLGVDRVKVSVVWGLVAPAASSQHRPRFDATNPAAYPRGAWNRYDLVVRVAQALGLKVYFQLTPVVPLWATYLPQQGDSVGRAPRPSMFRQFVEAVGRRYSGNYVDPSSPYSLPDVGLPIKLPPIGSQPQPFPRVSFWGIWNEPNYRSWLNPWYRRLSGGRTELLEPGLYRGLVDAAWNGLSDSGHSSDTILIGELANAGFAPIPFVRALYCVNSHYHALSGNAAVVLGCPKSPNRSRFVQDHPGLFEMTGFAHHPYQYNTPPNRPYVNPTWVTLDNIGVLERLLNHIFDSFGMHRSGGVPLYITEWGYKTKPPNPYSRTSLAQQAKWLDQGDYVTWRNPHIQSIAQFLLVDDQPDKSEPVGSRRYWGTFQTGLISLNGKPKPAFDDYRVPIWLPSQRHGASVTVWGQLRIADHSSLQYAVLEFRRTHSSTWTTLAEFQTASPEGYLLNHATIPASGKVRLAWLDPGNGKTYYSRTVDVY